MKDISDELALSIYGENERLQSLAYRLDDAGMRDAAHQVRNAACDLVRAIAAVVRNRADRMQEALQ